MCHRYLYLKVFMPVLVIGRGCQVLPGQAVSQLFPLADRAEHLALLRQDAALGPGLASRAGRRVPSPARVLSGQKLV